jgi:hypothetical protein
MNIFCPCISFNKLEGPLRTEDFERRDFKCVDCNQPLFPNTKPSAELIEYCERTQISMQDPDTIMGDRDPLFGSPETKWKFSDYPQHEREVNLAYEKKLEDEKKALKKSENATQFVTLIPILFVTWIVLNNYFPDAGLWSWFHTVVACIVSWLWLVEHHNGPFNRNK